MQGKVGDDFSGFHVYAILRYRHVSRVMSIFYGFIYMIKDGKIFAICLGGLFYCKRLYNLPLGGVRIVSDNSVEFPEIQLSAQEIIDQQLEIIGWVWQISSLESW